ncbi:uncharacterized protein C1orf87 homolog isoform X2 [Erinaceus europaeus]|uniref:Uncharacterized protein C1orf87 homolog isoform X2 n=1 Tax=Erinaceus europaeus TaxID=9365 RepID=A0ABM3YMJ0_ERIEU|nr:uncharacterized protein C1orf87 homolog isoform X2 [Erinaceus europaeus]
MFPVWKVPCESDAMPETVVKIIGSKHFRYLVEKPNTKENENMKAETQTVTQTVLPKSMTVNAKQLSSSPPATTNFTENQVNPKPNDLEECKHPQNQKPANNQKLLEEVHHSRFLDGRIPSQTVVHCSSVPSGDQSLSYIHGLPRRNLRDWSLEQMVRESSNQTEETGQRTSGTREDTFLLALVQKELKAYPLSSSLLDKLQKELKVLDPISSGFLLQSQLSRLFLKHEVPLQLPTVKMLCQRFSRQDSLDMVNYGKLLWFLKAAASDDLQQSKRVVDNNLKKIQSHDHQSQSATVPQESSSQSEVNKDLLEIFKMALRAANGKLNTENLILSFRKEDRSFSGYLPPPKVRAICGKHGLYLTLSLLETLLNHQELGYQDEIKWQSFVEFLSRASSDLSADLTMGKKQKETSATPIPSQVPEMPQSKSEHVESWRSNGPDVSFTTTISFTTCP